jgi:hypothetical protein
MRYIILTLLGAWTLGMAALFAFGAYGFWVALADSFVSGSSSTLNGHPISWSASLALSLWFFGVFLTFAGGSFLAGIDWMRKDWRQSRVPGSYHPAPRVRGDRVVVKEPYWYFLLFAGVWIVFAAGGMICSLVTVQGVQDLVAATAVGGLFILIGCGLLHWLMNRVEFDTEARTWRVCKGFWPFRSVESGPLSDASHVVVGPETREHDESGGPYQVLAVRLAWRRDNRPALHLTEGVIEVRWGKSDRAHGIEQWARDLADRLGLPVESNPPNHPHGPPS